MNTPLTVAKIVSLMAKLPSGIEDPLALDKLHREQEELAAALAANDSEGVLTEVADVVYYAIKALVNGQLSEADAWRTIVRASVRSRARLMFPYVTKDIFDMCVAKYSLRARPGNPKNDVEERAACLAALGRKK